MSKKEYPAPLFRHIDDEKWHEVRAQDHNGKRVSIYEKWLEFSSTFLSMYGRWDAGVVVPYHGHNCVNVIFVIKGSMMCGDVLCTPGMHITLYEGVPYGPLIAGPEGVEVFEVFMGDPTVWYADPEGYDAMLKERGIKSLPPPPITLPDWMKDARK